MKTITWIKRFLFILASLWAIWASVYIIFIPTTMQETVISTSTGSRMVEQATNEISWYESQGLWGITVVATFAFVYVVIGLLAWWDYLAGLVIFSILGILFTLLAALSIGGSYAPSLLGVILGWLFLGIENILKTRSEPAA